jgi:hypothetical protein
METGWVIILELRAKPLVLWGAKKNCPWLCGKGEADAVMK